MVAAEAVRRGRAVRHGRILEEARRAVLGDPSTNMSVVTARDRCWTDEAEVVVTESAGWDSSLSYSAVCTI